MNYTWTVAVFFCSPPTGENVEPSPFSMVNSTVPLPESLKEMGRYWIFPMFWVFSFPKELSKERLLSIFLFILDSCQMVMVYVQDLKVENSSIHYTDLCITSNYWLTWLSVGVTDRGYCCAYCSGNKNDNPGACCNKIKFILDMIRI